MQNAESVLDIYRKRGERGLPLDRVYRQLFNPELYLQAYGKIYRMGLLTNNCRNRCRKCIYSGNGNN